MDHQISATHNGVVLRPLRFDDLEDLRQLRNQKKDFFLQKSVISESDQEKWFKNYLMKPDDYVFVIDRNGFVGSVALYKGNDPDSSFEFGRFMVKDDSSGQGVGTLAMAMACAIAFSALRTPNIILEVLEENERARHLYKKIGFIEQGSQFLNGEDIVIMKLELDDFLKGYSDVYSSIEAQV